MMQARATTERKQALTPRASVVLQERMSLSTSSSCRCRPKLERDILVRLLSSSNEQISSPSWSTELPKSINAKSEASTLSMGHMGMPSRLSLRRPDLSESGLKSLNPEPPIPNLALSEQSNPDTFDTSTGSRDGSTVIECEKLSLEHASKLWLVRRRFKQRRLPKSNSTALPERETFSDSCSDLSLSLTKSVRGFSFPFFRPVTTSQLASSSSAKRCARKSMSKGGNPAAVSLPDDVSGCSSS
mmetsp:Transcript_33779/g.50086  ORF Transcript_33779/g.50086 Transcript_33779/m.50086 type:complete len:243 (+) Transcript_33779:1497-2225(+)